jgi:hypothetical protein
MDEQMKHIKPEEIDILTEKLAKEEKREIHDR